MRDPWTSIDLSQGQRLMDVRITVQGITQIGGRVLERSGKIVAGASVLILKPVYIEDRRGAPDSRRDCHEYRLGNTGFPACLPGVTTFA